MLGDCMLAVGEDPGEEAKEGFIRGLEPIQNRAAGPGGPGEALV